MAGAGSRSAAEAQPRCPGRPQFALSSSSEETNWRSVKTRSCLGAVVTGGRRDKLRGCLANRHTGEFSAFHTSPLAAFWIVKVGGELRERRRLFTLRRELVAQYADAVRQAASRLYSPSRVVGFLFLQLFSHIEGSKVPALNPCTSLEVYARMCVCTRVRACVCTHILYMLPLLLVTLGYTSVWATTPLLSFCIFN